MGDSAEKFGAGDYSAIAERFLAARRAATGLADYPGPFPEQLHEAYRVQDAAIAGWSRKIVGWKVGRVPDAYVERFGTDRLAGPIFDWREAGEAVLDMPVFAEGFAAGEAEFLLQIGTAPDAAQRAFTLDEAAAHIGAVHVGIEIASSPLPTINVLGPIAVVSDFGNNNGLLVGPVIADWRTSGFEDWDVTIGIDGAEVGRGRAASFPDGAIGSARFLFELLAARGIPLQAGQWISTGAIGGVHDAHVGQTVEAGFGGRFTLQCRLEAARPAAELRAAHG